MKKVELLSPAGNFECLKAAIHNGADAVYLSGKKFGARAYADNFDNDELIEAIEYSHLYGVKIYVTVNTLIKEHEINDVLEYITFLHENGVDAVIMQDLGMINLVYKTLPNLEIHASTQCHTTCDESLEFLKEIGCKRAVLAREMSLNEIKNLQSNIEKEVFIHGALCVSYSGQCLFSSMILNRSGNRGECAGMCRLAYDAYDKNNKIKTEGKYIFSPKELCTIKNLKEILDTNIDSLKIEGRMKSPIYVGYVTNLYRKYIDAYYNNKNIKVTEEEMKILKVLYNREFTTGHLFNNTIINSKTPNHIGYKIGIVKEIKKQIKILLIEDIEQGDAIRFIKNNLGMYLNFIYNDKGKLINSAKKGQIIYIDNKIDLKELDDVYLTYDKSLESILLNVKKIPINFSVKARVNENLIITITDDLNNTIEITGNKLEQSINNPTTKEIIKEKLNKINDTPFYLNNIQYNIDSNVFIPMKELNTMKRELIDKLTYIRKTSKKEVIKKQYTKNIKNTDSKIKEIKIISKENQYNNNEYFYTENANLYDKFKNNKNIYLILPRISIDYNQYNNEYLVANNTADLYKYYKNNKIHTGLYMNVYNTYTIDLLKQYNVEIITLSPELNGTDLKAFKTLKDVSYYGCGKLELMLLKNNILNNIEKAEIKDRNKETYNYYKRDNYYVLKTNKTIIQNEFIENLIRMKEE